MNKYFEVISSREYWRSAFYLTATSMRSTYKGTVLGIAWSVMHPFIQVIIYAVVFKHLARFSIENYSLYLVSGLVPWGLVSTVLPGSTASLISRGRVLKHCLVSKTVFPVSDTMTNVIMFVISFFAMYLPLSFWYGIARVEVLLMPIAVLPIIFFSLVWSVAISFIAPYLRDLSHLFSIGMKVMFWLTPIVYPMEAITKNGSGSLLYWIVTLNPFRYLILPIQIAVYGVKYSFIQAMGISSVIVLVSCFFCFLIYKASSKKVVFYV